MNSKEALDNIQYMLEQTNNLVFYKDEIKAIQRDLEVLALLKGYFNFTEYGEWYIDMQESDFDFKSECSKEEWDNSPQKKIKEWLK